MRRLAFELGIDLVVGHVDHGLRQGSSREAEWLEGWCAARSISFVSARVNVTGSGEAAARAARYEALEEMAERVSADRIATAHTADDQAETVLMRIVRGTGVRGLAGIPRRRGPFIRPMLEVPKSWVERFVSEAGLRPVTDPTNRDRRFFRNRVRHGLLAELRRENPAVDSSLCRLAATAREETDTLDELTARAVDGWTGTVEGPGGHVGYWISREVLGELPVGCLWWCLRRGHTLVRLGGLGGESSSAGRAHQLDRAHCERLRDLWRRASSGRLLLHDLPGGVCAALSSERLCLMRPEWLEDPGDLEWSVTGPGRWELDGLDATLVIRSDGEGAGLRPVAVRNWRPGDRASFGSAGSRKLQDVFVDGRVPRPLRRRIPLVWWGERSVAVPGHELATRGGGPTRGGPPGVAVELERWPGGLDRALATLFGRTG
jgi:tRNA(Ile)-lysidine synthase